MTEMSQGHIRSVVASAAADTSPDVREQSTQADLPPEFVEAFVRGVKDFNPVMASEMVEAGEVQAKASEFHLVITSNMSKSEQADLTALVFGDLATVSMVISEIQRAGIDMSGFASVRDLRKALRSRAFKRYAKAKAKTAQDELEALYEMEHTRKARAEEIRQKRIENALIIRDCKERMAARERYREELVRELEFAQTERPALLEKELLVAHEELAKILGEDETSHQ